MVGLARPRWRGQPKLEGKRTRPGAHSRTFQANRTAPKLHPASQPSETVTSIAYWISCRNITWMGLRILGCPHLKRPRGRRMFQDGGRRPTRL